MPRHSFAVLVGLVVVSLARTSFALPPGDMRGFREGANHHIGDAGFIAEFGRPPTSHDSEKVRMRTHFTYIREKLAGLPATRPELAAKRQQLLADLADYTARNTTPKNDHVPWRTPVFIDDEGTICAVGYLIERTAGRALAEKVAATNRYDLFEDIAAANPEVRAWVETTGLSLDELASIQPAYDGPLVQQWFAWNLEATADGPYDDRNTELAGNVRKHQMQGLWTRTVAVESETDERMNRVVGSGTFARGSGLWTSSYADGTRMAEGHYANSVPHGTWRFYHPSGNLAAEGRLTAGRRDGLWTFFYDSPDKVPLSTGRFSGGSVAGFWKHFDASGKLLATSRFESPIQWRGAATLVAVTAGADHVRHEIHQGWERGRYRRLDAFALGDERLYVRVEDDASAIYDADGSKLAEVDGTWQAQQCAWTPAEKRAARSGDTARLHGLLTRHRDEKGDIREACTAAVALSPARATTVAAILAAGEAPRAPVPAFMTRGDTSEDAEHDLVEIIATRTGGEIEWHHVDDVFMTMFRTMAGEHNDWL